MSHVRRGTAAIIAALALTAVAAPPANAGIVDDVVCYVKTGDSFRCFHMGP